MIAAKLQVIEEVQVEEWWRDITVDMVSVLQQDLRELVKFIDRQQQEIIYVNFADEMGEVQNINVPIQTSGSSRLQYQKKVEAYIRSNENNVAVAKLKRNIPLTDADLTALEEMLFNSEVIEDREIFAEVYGQNISLKLFIRKLFGLDRNAAKELFSKYLTSKFNTNQIRFVENIIDYLTQNGVMFPELLYEPPFTDLHREGLDGIFPDKEADNIIEILTEINESVDFDVA
jgi:type I restriction enzyme R subunit